MKKKPSYLIAYLLCLMIHVASAQEVKKNVWSKENSKETFQDKVKRFEKEGLKMAVFVNVDSDVKRYNVTDSDKESGKNSLAPSKGSFYFKEKSLFQQFEELTLSKLKDKFDSEIFVIIDGNDFKMKTEYGERIEDFWKTDFKAVMIVGVKARYSGHTEFVSDNKYELDAEFKVSVDIKFKEYFAKKGSDRSKNIGSAGPKRLYEKDHLQEFKGATFPRDLDKVDALILDRLRGEDLYNEIQPKYVEMVDKIIDKLSK
ncbi:MAG: hypothetical protein JXR07_17435 [Reichenbachiella sp.]